MNYRYKSLAGVPGIPNIHWYGTELGYNILVMDLLGPSLEDLLNFCNREFSISTVVLLALQLLKLIEYIHVRSFIHRDIKPDNFLIGVGRRSTQVYAIDFGLAKRFRDPRTNVHIPYREHKSLTGTARYASIYTHMGYEQSRRDDMESLGYMLVYFCKGSLPWQGLKANTKKQKYERIMDKKMSTPVATLCRGLPQEFERYISYCRSLAFNARPDYLYLKTLFDDFYKRENYYGSLFDWTVIQYEQMKMQEKWKGERRGATTQNANGNQTQNQPEGEDRRVIN